MRWEQPPGDRPTDRSPRPRAADPVPPEPGWVPPPSAEDPGRPLYRGRPDYGPEQRMAELSTLYDVDMVDFRPTAHDVRIERDGFVYYVRAVRWGESLCGESTTGPSFNMLGMVLLVVGGVAWRGIRRGVHALQRRPRWRVGVVVGPAPSSWNTGDVKQLHQERLEPGEHPARRIAELAAEVDAGEFDPS